MAMTISLYNRAAKAILNKEIDTDALKVMLLDNTAAFDATHTTLTQVAGAANAKEVSGNGWAVGGELLANVVIATVDTNDANLDADDIEVTAVGGPIGPASFGVIYDDTDADDAPLAFINFDGAKEAGETTDFVIRWHDSGLLALRYTLPS